MKNEKIYLAPENEGNTENYIREIYDENEYNRFGVKIEPGDIVLDCGANIGIFTNYALDMGASKVYSYEADGHVFEFYNKNVNNPNVYPTFGMVGHEQHNLSIIKNQHGLNEINFAKIDIEGSEWDLFKFMTSEDLQSVNKWAIEFHTFAGNPTISMEDKKNRLWSFLELLEKFSINGFNIYFEQIHKGWDVVHLFAKKISK
jgi:hypothetical protein